MELQKLDGSYRADGSKVVEKSYKVRSARHAVQYARNDLHGQPWFGLWRIMRKDGRWVDFQEAATALYVGELIEWRD